MQNVMATLEDILAVYYKTEDTLTIQSDNLASFYLPKGAENLCLCNNLHMDVYSTFIHKAMHFG